MKQKRHGKILDIIRKQPVATQEELAEALRLEGIEVTQATVSRDIKDLRLIKVLTAGGRSRYASSGVSGMDISGRLLTIFSESFVSADFSGTIVVVRTLPGMAQASGASIDSLKWPEILGTIAGDDTIMIVCRDREDAERIVRRFDEMATL